MKRSLFFISAIILMTSCVDYHYTEPVYDARDRVVGYYEVEEFSQTYQELISYDIYVSKGRYTNNEIFLDDFYAANTRVLAYVDADRITIPLQVTNGYEIRGSGWVNNGRLTLDYRVKDLERRTYTDYCEAIAYRY